MGCALPMIWECQIALGCTVPTHVPTYPLNHSLIYIGRSIITHLYWVMKNCEEDPDKLCAIITDHYQDDIIRMPMFYMVDKIARISFQQGGKSFLLVITVNGFRKAM